MLLDDLFSREFNRTLSVLPTEKSIYKLPVPNFDKGMIYTHTIKNIEDEYYSKLNDEKVTILKKSGVDFKRRILGSGGKFRKDKNGKIKTESVQIPTGSVVVVTPVRLGLPYGYSPSTEGLGYIDYTKAKDGNIYYMYYIPKEYVYTLQKTALVVSSKKMKGYHGFSFRTWNFGKVFVWVIPYDKNREYQNTRIVKVKEDLDFTKEIADLYNFWIQQQVISPGEDYLRSDGVSIAYEELEPTYDSYDFESFSPVSLAHKDIIGGEGFEL